MICQQNTRTSMNIRTWKSFPAFLPKKELTEKKALVSCKGCKCMPTIEFPSPTYSFSFVLADIYLLWAGPHTNLKV